MAPMTMLVRDWTTLGGFETAVAKKEFQTNSIEWMALKGFRTKAKAVMQVWLAYRNVSAHRIGLWADGYIPMRGALRADEAFRERLEEEIGRKGGRIFAEADLRLLVCEPRFSGPPQTSFDYELYAHRSVDYRLVLLTSNDNSYALTGHLKSSIMSSGFRNGRNYRNYRKFREGTRKLLHTITNFSREPISSVQSYLDGRGFTVTTSR